MSENKAVAVRIREDGKILVKQLCVISYDGTPLEPFQSMAESEARRYYGQELEIDTTRVLDAETQEIVPAK
jgi:hypothetical protein